MGLQNIMCRDFRGVFPSGQMFSGDFQGTQISLWYVIFLNIAVTTRSLIHLFAPESGLVSIAGLDNTVEGWGNVNAMAG